MNAKPDIQILTNFLSEYTTAMVGAGTYTARVEKCVDRIAKRYGFDVSVTIFVKYFTISVMDFGRQLPAPNLREKDPARAGEF